MTNKVHTVVVQPKPGNAGVEVGCCERFGDNLKVSSCFIMNAYSNCIDGCDNSKNTVTTPWVNKNYNAERAYNPKAQQSGATEHAMMSMKECSQCLCLCGLIPLTAQVALLPFTLTGSMACACCGKSCKE